MSANMITLTRLILVFVVVALFNINFYANLAMLIMTIIIIAMDWADGYVARKQGTTSDFGALFDIAGDRIVENVLWIYFAVVHLVPFWVPMIVIVRGFVTDLIRSMAFAQGKTPFGKKTMMDSRWAKALVSSRISRAVYAVSKVVAFCYLAGILTLNSAISEFSISIPDGIMKTLMIIGAVIVYVTIAMCVVRGFPVIWDGRKYFAEVRQSA
ncbi:MAG: CDP-alcohol phosphatidyltransferase family protein [Candidatus Poribacteria bacterium]